MTEEDFIRNNRAINGGKNLPPEYLSELFQSISANAISLSGDSSPSTGSKWTELINRSSSSLLPFIFSCPDPTLQLHLFLSISGPSVATLCAIFEHADDPELLDDCVDALFSVAGIVQHGPLDAMDELISSLCKFTTLLNPYVTTEETLHVLSHNAKPRLAILTVFSIASTFQKSVRAGWRNIVDCLLKLKTLGLLPHSILQLDVRNPPAPAADHTGVVFPGTCNDLPGRFSQFLSIADAMGSSHTLDGDFEQNLATIQQSRLGDIFLNSSAMGDESLTSLGRALIFAAAGKGQKFSTAVEEEDTVGFCWALITTLASANTHRILTFWPCFHDHVLAVAQFPFFSPNPFSEKAIVAVFSVCIKSLSSPQVEGTEESIFKTINLICKLEKELLDTCSVFIARSVAEIVKKCSSNIHSIIGWKTIFHLLCVTGRHPEAYCDAVETLIIIMSDAPPVSIVNYTSCIECALGFVALRNSPLEKSMKVMDLMAESVRFLGKWNRDEMMEAAETNQSNTSCSSAASEDGARGCSSASSNLIVGMFIRLGEAFRRTSLARREEVRVGAIAALRKSFELAEELRMSGGNWVSCMSLVVFAMVDDLQEKMTDYLNKEGAEREVRSLERAVVASMGLLVDVCLWNLGRLGESPRFGEMWLGVLRRMGTCSRSEFGVYGHFNMHREVAGWLRKMMSRMKEEGALVRGGDLWHATCNQMQWIASSLTEEEELFSGELFVHQE